MGKLVNRGRKEAVWDYFFVGFFRKKKVGDVYGGDLGWKRFRLV